ncbi:MAG TPA: phosphatidate cytidylyltransferase, partial [Elusimicrobiota bacterium]|nr:phosphatidate cytidylyltransferase [Elusimicrobiota bacterium]
MLLPRVLTAAVGIPLFLYVIHLGGWPFLFLCAGLALLALHEYATVLWLGGRGVQRYLVCVLGTALALCVGVSGPAFPAAPGLSSAAVSLVVLAAMLRELIRSEHSLDRAALTILGALFIGWPLGHVALLRQRAPGGEGLVYLLFACVWATDTLAYAAGRAFGR